MKHLNLFGLNFLSTTMSEAALLVVKSAQQRQSKIVVTPNVDHIVQFEKDSEMEAVFKKADFIFADGMPLVWLSHIIYQTGLPERINGTNLMTRVCQLASTRGMTVALVGGKPGAAELASQNLAKQFPGLRVVGTYCPPMGFEIDSGETSKLCRVINEWQPDILCFGVGTPKQEKWISKSHHKISIGITLCIGASIEFVAGLVPRAPEWMQNSGLEWLWRLMMEPRRLWRRYLVRDMRFLYLAFAEIMQKIRHRSQL